MNQIKSVSLRLWPGAAIVVFIWVARYVLPLIIPETLIFGVLGGVFGGTAVFAAWWLFFSRAPWIERLSVIAIVAVAMYATSFLVHKSIATAMTGILFPIYATPFVSLAVMAGLLVGKEMTTGARQAVVAVCILLVCTGFMLVRTDGMYASSRQDFSWRWSQTAEQRLLAQSNEQQLAMTTAPLPADPVAAWPGFRGPNRDAIVRDLRIETDWNISPPAELWRHPVGPGVSSFAIRGDLFYTQEQRGEDEIVSCYSLSTGEPVWLHHDRTRYWESHAGAGPRATPTIQNGRIYTFGGTGIVNVLDAETGRVFWSRNAAADTEVKLPDPNVWYGFSGSPLVLDAIVVIATSGALVAYDRETGEPRWFGPKNNGQSYSSPQLFTVHGVPQIIMASKANVAAFSPKDGTILWEHPWKIGERIVQPKLIARSDFLISAGEGNGLRRISVLRDSTGWRTEERWTTNGLKPYLSDFVVHDGYAYGFDGSILACIDLETGKRKWKGGRYGSGQMVLLAEQGLLLVTTEQGELALVNARPDKFTELASFSVIEGKTWNHPALSNDVLLIRNAREMAAFRLPKRAD